MSRCSEDELREAFSCFDADGSGFVSASELLDVLKQCGLEGEEAEVIRDEILQDADTDGDGKISFEEFKVALMKDE